eukprot:tig00001373_g8444.t1
MRQFVNPLFGVDRSGIAARSGAQSIDVARAAYASYNASSILQRLSNPSNGGAFGGVPKTPTFNPQELVMSERFIEKQDPFFEQVRLLGVVGLGTTISMVNIKGEFEIDRNTFAMIQGDLVKRRAGEKCGLAVHVRLFSHKHKDVGWVPEMRPKINRRPVDPPVLRKVRHVKGASKEPYVTYPPMDITQYIASGRNLLELERPTALFGVAAVQLVAMRTPHEVVQRMMRGEQERAALAAAMSGCGAGSAAGAIPGGADPAGAQRRGSIPAAAPPPVPEEADSDLEIEEQVTTVSLRCPLSYQRLRVAAKGRACKHPQCFDLQAFLEFSHQQHVWHCPVCNQPLPYSQLVVDGLMSRVLESVSPEETHVVVLPDGSWQPPGPAHGAPASGTKRRRSSGDGEAAASPGRQEGLRGPLEGEGAGPSSPAEPPAKRVSSAPKEPEVIVLDSDDEELPRPPPPPVVIKTEPDAAPPPQEAPVYPFPCLSARPPGLPSGLSTIPSSFTNPFSRVRSAGAPSSSSSLGRSSSTSSSSSSWRQTQAAPGEPASAEALLEYSHQLLAARQRHAARAAPAPAPSAAASALLRPPTFSLYYEQLQQQAQQQAQLQAQQQAQQQQQQAQQQLLQQAQQQAQQQHFALCGSLSSTFSSSSSAMPPQASFYPLDPFASPGAASSQHSAFPGLQAWSSRHDVWEPPAPPPPSPPPPPPPRPAPGPPSDIIILDLDEEEEAGQAQAPPPPRPALQEGPSSGPVLAAPIWTGFSRLPEILPAEPPEEPGAQQAAQAQARTHVQAQAGQEQHAGQLQQQQQQEQQGGGDGFVFPSLIQEDGNFLPDDWLLDGWDGAGGQ